MMNVGYLKHAYIHKTKQTQRFIHRMVAERFLPKINDISLVVDHINRDKTDNRASNLRWVSRSVNVLNTNVKTNTGERFIHKKYIVEITVPYYHKSFNTIEDAMTARDKILQDYILHQ
jgi:hypothetical protein